MFKRVRPRDCSFAVRDSRREMPRPKVIKNTKKTNRAPQPPREAHRDEVLWQTLIADGSCEMCSNPFPRFREHCIRMTYHGHEGLQTKLLCPGCAGHVCLGFSNKYSQPFLKWSVCQHFALHGTDLHDPTPVDREAVNERMCQICDQFLVAIFIRLTYEEGKGPVSGTHAKQCCFWCAARCFADLHVGLAKLQLSNEPCLYEVVE